MPLARAVRSGPCAVFARLLLAGSGRVCGAAGFAPALHRIVGADVDVSVLTKARFAARFPVVVRMGSQRRGLLTGTLAEPLSQLMEGK